MVAIPTGLPTVSSPFVDQDRLLTPWARLFLQAVAAGAAGATPVGLVQDWPAATPPVGWLICDGSAVSRTTFASLFGVVGTTWGAGDGATTFNLPDLRGKFTLGVSSSHHLATTGGAESVVLTVPQLPAHNHGVIDPTHTHVVTDPQHTHAVTDPTHSHTLATESTGAGAAVAANASATPGTASTNAAATGITIQAAATGVTNQAAATGITTQNTGSGSAVSILPPYAALTKIIYAGV